VEQTKQGDATGFSHDYPRDRTFVSSATGVYLRVLFHVEQPTYPPVCTDLRRCSERGQKLASAEG